MLHRTWSRSFKEEEGHWAREHPHSACYGQGIQLQGAADMAPVRLLARVSRSEKYYQGRDRGGSQQEVEAI